MLAIFMLVVAVMMDLLYATHMLQSVTTRMSRAHSPVGRQP